MVGVGEGWGNGIAVTVRVRAAAVMVTVMRAESRKAAVTAVACVEVTKSVDQGGCW